MDLYEAIVEEARTASRRHRDFIQRDFSEAEMALGFQSFCLWMISCHVLKSRGEELEFEFYFDNPNVSARGVAAEYSARVLGKGSVVGNIRKKFPSFDHTIESSMAADPVSPGAPEWKRWEHSLTRIVILLTRSIAYALVGDELNMLEFVSINKPKELIRISRDWLSENLGRQLADELTREFFAVLKANHGEAAFREWKAAVQRGESLAKS